MMVVVDTQTPTGSQTCCYMHGLEIVRHVRMAGTSTLCLHAGQATPNTRTTMTAVCNLLLPRVGLSVTLCVYGG